MRHNDVSSVIMTYYVYMYKVSDTTDNVSINTGKQDRNLVHASTRHTHHIHMTMMLHATCYVIIRYAAQQLVKVL